MEQLVFCMTKIGLLIAILVGSCSVLTDTHECNYNKDDLFLNCSGRALQSVPILEPHFNEALRMDLSGNLISRIINGTFSNAKKLLILDLSNNTIRILEASAFHGLQSLISLNLSANHFAFSVHVITPDLFSPLISLREMRIQRYPTAGNYTGIDVAFSKLTNLTALFLDIPTDFIFGHGFADLKKLTTISTSGRDTLQNNCNSGTLWKSTFQVFRNVPVRELRLIKCNISSIEKGAFEPLTSLDVLDLSFNVNLEMRHALQALYSFQYKNMTELNLVALNNVSCLSPKNYALESNDFVYLSKICVKSVDLSHNFISYINISLQSKFNLTCLESLNMSYHSFHCMPKSLLNILSESPTLKSVDISHGYGSPSSEGYYLPRVRRIDRPQVIVLPPNLKWFSFSSFGNWYYANSTFNFSSAYNLRHLGAAYINLNYCGGTTVYGLDSLPSLDLSGITCDEISPDYFKYINKLKILKLSNSPYMNKVLNSPKSPFLLLQDLEEIDLSMNKLDDVSPRLFEKNVKLRKINFHDNKLQRLPSAISEVATLEHLDLSSNAFTELFPQEMRIIDSLIANMEGGESFKLLLGMNPLQCNCETVLFIEWVQAKQSYLDNPGDYRCVMSNGDRRSLNTFLQNIRDFEVNCISQTYLMISVFGGLTLLVLLVLLIGIYRYRVNLRYWLYSKLKPPESMFVRQDYVYDAFVAYNSSNYDWVYNELHSVLENCDTPIRLCFHDRDFIPGRPIHRNIVDKIRESRKILLIISKDFLDSLYGPLEIEYAGMKCVEEGRDDVIICVLLEDIPVGKMPSALRNLWNKITFLEWNGEPAQQRIFWRNLWNALIPANT